MESNAPIHVWRAVGTPKYPPSEGKCLYCGAKLETGGKLHDISFKRREEERKQGELKWFGNYLDQMTDADWDFHLQANKLSNEKSIQNGVNDWLMPTDKEDSIELFYHTCGTSWKYLCKRCGWWKDFTSYQHSGAYGNYAAAVMQSFPINDSEITIAEITSHLSRKYSDIYSITPRKFEEVVANIYKNAGWETRLTKQSRDGGVDIICLSKDGETCLVECKRYAERRSVGISAVDRLLGVAYRQDAPIAHLVTTSRFSRPAKEVVSEVESRNSIELSLIDAHDLSLMLGLYSDKNLTVMDLESILKHQSDGKKT